MGFRGGLRGGLRGDLRGAQASVPSAGGKGGTLGLKGGFKHPSKGGLRSRAQPRLASSRQFVWAWVSA